MQVNEAILKRTVGRSRDYLDLHSVVDGIRGVALIALVSKPSRFNRGTGTSIPSFKEQERVISRYLGLIKRGEYKFIKGYHSLYFIATRERAQAVRQFLTEYGLPLSSNDKEGLYAIGKLLGYSQCCIDALIERRSDRNSAWRIIPFAPCSPKCGERWLRVYEELAEHYNVSSSTRFFR